jgi:hypothetical protein
MDGRSRACSNRMRCLAASRANFITVRQRCDAPPFTSQVLGGPPFRALFAEGGAFCSHLSIRAALVAVFKQYVAAMRAWPFASCHSERLCSGAKNLAFPCP